MCTLSVITRDDGFALAMNRDELLARDTAFPPSKFNLRQTVAAYPRDDANGTWVAANNHGIALALLNWNDGALANAEKKRSRGIVIPALIGSSSLNEVRTALQQFDLQGILPFRLISIFSTEKRICEWRWNVRELQSQFLEWKPRHWFSSSISDEQAGEYRGAACASAWNDPHAGSLPWLRALHASHDNGPGPFSICVHRENVGTLSYAEIECTPAKVAFNYSAGSPCLKTGFHGRSK